VFVSLFLSRKSTPATTRPRLPGGFYCVTDVRDERVVRNYFPFNVIHPVDYFAPSASLVVQQNHARPQEGAKGPLPLLEIFVSKLLLI
jgi:hypothetical protein